MQKTKKAIITGASGFLGFSLVKYLLEQDVSVYCICRPSSPNLTRLHTYLQALPPDQRNMAKVVELDLHDLSKLPGLIPEECDLFYHLGWDGGVKIESGQDLNILTSAMALLGAVKTGCKRFIASGSQAEYGLHTKRIFENSMLHPVTSYGEAKVAAYFLTKTLAEKHGIKHIWCRIFSAYGPDENPDTLLHYCISSLLDGVSPMVTPCEQLWNFTYQDDIAEAFYRLGTTEVVNGVYNIASPDCRSLKEYLHILHQSVSKFKPDLPEINFGARSYSFQQVMHLEPDIGKLVRDIGCQSKMTFEEGIELTIKAHLSKGQI